MKVAMIENLNKYLADVGVLYMKIHNLHWNVVGRNFKTIHEYLQTIYEDFALVLDDTAEVIKIEGGKPLASLKSFLEVSDVKELESNDLSVNDVLAIAIEDMRYIKNQAEVLRKKAGEDDVYQAVTMLEDQLRNYNKTIWFLESMVK